MKTINSRIKQIIEELKITPYEFSKQMGNNRPDGIYKLLNHEDVKPSPKTINKILETFSEINPTWLLTGVGEMFIKKQHDVLNSSDESSNIVIAENKHGNKITIVDNENYFITIPLVEFNVYAGKIDEYQEAVKLNSFEQYITFSIDHFAKGNYLAFKVSGYSMDNGLLYDTPDGAKVLGRELGKQHWMDGFNESKYGWVIISKAGMVFKDIVGFNKENATITLRSRNSSPEFSDFDLCLDDIFQIFKVVSRMF